MMLGRSLGRLILPPDADRQPITVVAVRQNDGGVPHTVWEFSHPVVILQLDDEDPWIECQDESLSGWYPGAPFAQINSYRIRFTCDSAPSSILMQWRITGTPTTIGPAQPSLHFIANGEGEVLPEY